MFSKFQIQRIVFIGSLLVLFGGLTLIWKGFSISPVVASDLQTTYLPIVNTPAQKIIFGAEMNPITNDQGLHKMAEANISWVRRNGILWSKVEPVQGAGYDWSVLAEIEQDFLRARANNMEVILVIRGVPEWARVPPYNYECGPMDPNALSAFGDFMYAVVQRYSGYPYSIKYWEIWNEPDVYPGHVSSATSPFGCLGDITDTTYYGGAFYTALLQAVYPRVKQANPNAQVVLGGLLLDCNPLVDPNTCVSARYLEGVLATGGKNYFDGVSFHAYDYFTIGETDYQTGIYGNPGWQSGGSNSTLNGELKPVLVAKTAYLKHLFSLYNVEDKFLINTETALLCGALNALPGGPTCEATPDSYFEKLKAAYMPQTYASAIAEGLLANIWYTPMGWRNSGLFFENFTPRPAYTALMLAQETLQNATFVRELSELNEPVFGYEFLLENQPIWVLWTLDGKTHPLTFSQVPFSVFDELGNPVTLNGSTMTVAGLKTYYVDWTP
ncbi:MAG: hypothetical protein Fur0022_34900 [Anaerolineales bacterium]